MSASRYLWIPFRSKNNGSTNVERQLLLTSPMSATMSVLVEPIKQFPTSNHVGSGWTHQVVHYRQLCWSWLNLSSNFLPTTICLAERVLKVRSGVRPRLATTHLSMNRRRKGEGLGCIGLQTWQALGERDVTTTLSFFAPFRSSHLDVRDTICFLFLGCL